jgi:hypothetical protein
MTTDTFSRKTIYPNIDVYTNLLPDIDMIHEYMKESEQDSKGQYFVSDWSKWSIFGTYSSYESRDENHLIGKSPEFLERYRREKYFYDRILEAYELAITDYIEKNNLQMPPVWHKINPSFCKYNSEVEYGQEANLTMQYHSDYFEAESEMPGNKFLITCTMYINDDYDGGEIAFYVNGDRVEYKPEPGSIVIFPSKPPYYHAVKKIKNGNKFLVRKFITYPFAGTQEWLSNQMNHGPIRWAEMEKARLEKAKDDMPDVIFGPREEKEFSRMDIHEKQNSPETK